VTISRQNIAAYLNSQYSGLAAAVGQDVVPLDGYAPDIDSALRKLGTLESDLSAATVADSLRDAVFALGEYYAALRIWRQLGDRANHTMGETQYSYTDQRANVKAMMEDAADKCANLGYSVDGRKLRTASFRVY